VLPSALVKYLVNRTAYDETTAWCYMFHIALNLWSEVRPCEGFQSLELKAFSIPVITLSSLGKCIGLGFWLG